MKPSAFAALAEEVFETLPPEILGYVDNVVFLIEPWPDEEVLRSLGLEDRYDLMGLYEGLPLDERSTDLWGVLPDRILLYQQPIEYEAQLSGQSVAQVIRDTLLHEIGHHFGLEEEDLLHLEEQRAADEDTS